MTTDPTPTIVFVYNADSGAVNAIIDGVHKLISPSTYRCSLCAVTHTPLGERKTWARFVESLDYPTRFLHRDEFEPPEDLVDLPLPAIVLEYEDGATRVLLDAETIGECRSSEALERVLGMSLMRLV